MRLTSHVMPNATVHGPYLDKRLRRRVVNVELDGRRFNMTYARFLMQEHLGRRLSDQEHVDHMNDDRLDDRVENLQVLSPRENIQKSQGEVTWYEFDCPECGRASKKDMRHVRNNWKKGRPGPYCGRACAGRANARR